MEIKSSFYIPMITLPIIISDTIPVSSTLYYGALITFGALFICALLAIIISTIRKRRSKGMMEKIRDHEQELFRTNEKNELQLVMLNTVIKATKIALWDMEIKSDDPIDPQNKLIWTNDFRKLLGFTHEYEFPNVLESWSNRLHPDDKGRTLNAFKNHIQDITGRIPFDIEYRLLKKNNEYSYYRATGETLRDSDGKALRVAGALMDITEAREREISFFARMS